MQPSCPSTRGRGALRAQDDPQAAASNAQTPTPNSGPRGPDEPVKEAAVRTSAAPTASTAIGADIPTSASAHAIRAHGAYGPQAPTKARYAALTASHTQPAPVPPIAWGDPDRLGTRAARQTDPCPPGWSHRCPLGKLQVVRKCRRRQDRVAYRVKAQRFRRLDSRLFVAVQIHVPARLARTTSLPQTTPASLPIE